MNRMHTNFLRAILLLVLCLSLTFGFSQPVQAETCTWEGDTSADWFTPANWSCGSVPKADDDVVISSGTPNQPTIGEIQSVTVNTITINTGAALTILSGSAVNAGTWTIDGAVNANTADSLIYINYNGGTGSGVVNVGTAGTITKLGTGNLIFYSSFNNAGTVTFTDHGTGDGGVNLLRGGTHTGIFQGEYLFIGDNATVSSQIFNFDSGSAIRANFFHARGGTVNIIGTYSPPENSGTYLIVQPTSGTNFVYFKNGADILKMAENVWIRDGGKLIFESQVYNYNMTKLDLEYGGELQNFDDLTISTQFLWMAGKITGNGTTTVENPAVFTMGTSVYAQNDFTLDTQTLVNNSTANWNKRDLTLVNSAEFVNNGTFNANAATTMSGGETVRFQNNGSFYKNTAGTTTTINVGFINDGLVQVNAGSLVFPLGLDNGEDTTINLNGGTLDPGETLTLESGDSLVGTGTLSANLLNSGTVSPGNSPGIITIDGDYTQQSTGILNIELGGTTPGTGHDQMIVTGTATMHGTLNVTLLPGFSPQAGDTFYIIDHVTGTRTFDTVSLPVLGGGLEMQIDFSDEGVTLTVEGGDTYSIFLPLIVR